MYGLLSTTILFVVTRISHKVSTNVLPLSSFNSSEWRSMACFEFSNSLLNSAISFSVATSK